MKRFIPVALLRLRQRWILSKSRRRYGKMTTEATFAEIYNRGLWGGNSGTGSNEEFSKEYCDFVVQFAQDHNVDRVVDIGCGDFRVGRKIAEAGLEYIGVDVAGGLIDRHQREFSRKNISFVCLDATEQRPPAAELCLIRQVLQHLSNAEIACMLNNCRGYSYMLITEHLPTATHIQFNKDKPHGPDTRMHENSGVFLDKAPFSLSTATVLEVPFCAGEVLRTVLILNNRETIGVRHAHATL